MSRFVLLTFLTFSGIYCTVEAKQIVCYFGSWAAYRQGDGKFEVENIDPFLCTHVIYTFVILDQKPGIGIKDAVMDIDKGGLRRVVSLKNKNPALKVMVAIGGANDSPSKYSTLLSNPANRETFANDALNFVQKHGFDGLDVDWEFPSNDGRDKSMFTELVKTLHEKFKPHGLLISAAVAALESSFTQYYDVKEIGRYLDFINVMTYDLHGFWQRQTGHNAPLYVSSYERGTQEQKLTVDGSIRAWISIGVLPSKLVLGIPLYGRTYKVASADCNKLKCSAVGTFPGPFTQESGMMGYNEICLEEKNYKKEFDQEAQVPYLHSGDKWISYDDVQSVAAKVDYINKMKLGGAMVWSIETDDFLGACGGGKFPLLTTIKNKIQ